MSATVVASFLLAVASLQVEGSAEDVDVALTRASYAGDNDRVLQLLNEGAEVDALVDVGHPYDTVGLQSFTTYLGPPVLWAAIAGHASTVRVLADAGANVDLQDTSGLTALMWAVDRGRLDAVAALLEVGADPEASPYTALMRSARRGQNDIVRLLLQHGAKIDTLNVDHGTALMYAVASQHRDTVEFLLEEGADANIAGGRSLHGDGRWPDPTQTPLIVAAWTGNPEIVRSLLKHGAEMKAEDEAGYTALDWATLEGHTDVVAILGEHRSK